MTRKEQIQLLYNELESGLSDIENKYNSSITAKHLDKSILIKIKNFLENARTILDFLAKEVMDKFCDQQIRNFFPILKIDSTDTQIRNSITGCFPGLENNRLDVFNYFIDLQPKYDVDNSWLLELNLLCGSNKHEILSPQIRKDQIVNVITLEKGITFFWTDGLVEFPKNPNQPIIIKSAGMIARCNTPDKFFSDNQILGFGWIVKKLVDHKITSGPLLDNLEKDSFSLDSYMIGNFYFPDQIVNAYSQLKNFKEKILRTIEQLYRLIEK